MWKVGCHARILSYFSWSLSVHSAGLNAAFGVWLRGEGRGIRLHGCECCPPCWLDGLGQTAILFSVSCLPFVKWVWSALYSLSSSCHNRIPWTGRGLNNRHLFSHSPGGSKSKMKVLVDSVSREDSFPVLQRTASWLCPPTGRELWCLFI